MLSTENPRVCGSKTYEAIKEASITTSPIVIQNTDSLSTRRGKKVSELGADFIKIYNDLSREAFYGIADESRKPGTQSAGHVPVTASALEASDAGQKSIEHSALIPIATSDTYPDITREHGLELSDQEQLEFHKKLVGDMHKTGVNILAGSDANFYCFPECNIHDELELYVEAGLSPLVIS